MANFNEKVNSGIGYILNSQEFFIYRTGTIKEFAQLTEKFKMRWQIFNRIFERGWVEK